MTYTEDITLPSIAVIGLSGRFPGAKNVDVFWNNIENGIESICFLNEKELLELGVDKELLNNPRFVRAVSLIKEMEYFDAKFFGLTPREAEITDPQHRLLLECAKEVLENAGYVPENYIGKIGVYVGVGVMSYLFKNLLSNPEFSEASAIQRVFFGNDKGFAATKISHKLNLTGPSMVIDTACSTSLAAVHQACKSLLLYESDMAIAGGACVNLFRTQGYLYEEGGIESSDGHNRAFDERSNGTVFGSGIGLVLLKRLDDALTDKDYIHAVIRGSALNNDGALKAGYAAPSAEGQAQVVAEAIALSGVSSETISYVEAHGTGTQLGDPVEMQGLIKAFNTRKQKYCAIGSVKTNIGHLDAAAGIAGLIKTILALKNKKIPPSLHYINANPQINFDESPFYVNTSLIEWPRDEYPRRAGVSSFGIGGTNVHVILEEMQTSEQLRNNSDHEKLFILSAKTNTSLVKYCATLAEYLKVNRKLNLDDVSYTLQVGRSAYSEREAFLAKTNDDVIKNLEIIINKERKKIEKKEKMKILFAFSSKSVFPLNMVSDLYKFDKVFQLELNNCAGILKKLLDIDILELIENNVNLESHLLNDHKILKLPLMFSIEYSIAKMLISWNIVPEIMIAFGAGEYIAACVSESIALDDALELITIRSKFIDNCGSFSLECQNLIERKLKTTSVRNPRIFYISAITGSWVNAEEVKKKEYWLNSIEQESELQEIITALDLADEYVLVELSLDNLFSNVAKNGQHFQNRIFNIESNLNKTILPSLLKCVENLWSLGFDINWVAYNIRSNAKRIPLPSYQFDSQYYWIKEKEKTNSANNNFELENQIKYISNIEKNLRKKLGYYGYDYYSKYLKSLNELCLNYICQYFQKNNISVLIGQKYSRNEIIQKLGVQPSFLKFVDFFLAVLEEDKVVIAENENIKFIKSINEIRDQELISRELLSGYPELKPMLEFLDHCVLNYTSGLKGDINPLAILFPDGNTSYLENTFKHILAHSNYILYASLLAQTVLHYVNTYPGKTINILEVGSGKGELTKIVTSLLIGKNVRYYYTDIGLSFVRNAQEKSDTFNLNPNDMFFRVFDISQEPTLQGFNEQSFDIIIGFDVVHATKNINTSLENLKKLLVSKGILCIIETVVSLRWIEMIWGLTTGWWCFEDSELRKLTPLIDALKWKNCLDTLEFNSVQIFPQHLDDIAKTDYAFMLAQNGNNPNQLENLNPTNEKKDVSLVSQDSSLDFMDSTEIHLLELWKELFGIISIKLTDDFYALGGDSLVAAEMLAKIRKKFDMDLSIKVLFDNPNVQKLAAQIKQIKGDNSLFIEKIKTVSRDEPLALSYSQEALWFAEQLNGPSATYNIPAALQLKGVLNIEAMINALRSIVTRHEVLRVNFKEINGTPCQIINEIDNFEIPIFYINQNEVNNTIKAFVLRPFNIASDFLFNACILCVSKEENILLVNMHHIVSDGWSLGILVEELAVLYNSNVENKNISLPLSDIQYIDYAHWQRKLFKGELLDKQLEYWKKQLSGLKPLLELPTDFIRPSTFKMKGAVEKFQLNREITDKLSNLAKGNDVTLFMCLLSCFYLLLYQLTNIKDIAVGTTNANRTHSDLEKLVGIFVNQLVLRTSLNDNPTFIQLLHRVRDTALNAYANQDLPFVTLVSSLRQKRALSYTPIFQVLFVLQKLDIALDLPQLEVRSLEIDDLHPKFDISLFMEETSKGLIGSFIYNAELFKQDTILKIKEKFIDIIKLVIDFPTRNIEHFNIMKTSSNGDNTNMSIQELKNIEKRSLKNVKRKSISLDSIDHVDITYIDGKNKLMVFQPNHPDLNFIQWISLNKNMLSKKILDQGAILFRGFCNPSISNFEQFTSSICADLFSEYGDLPQETGSKKVYKSTPYPSEQPILFHNESSHLHQWPMKQFFSCIKAAEQGGETPIVDCRKIYKLLSPDLIERFSKKKLMYVRNFIPSVDVSWQDFYRTTDPKLVEKICIANDSQFEWNKNYLKVSKLANAITTHPQTKEKLFFNQILLHHISCVEEKTRNSLLTLFKIHELPRNVFYGDGTDIEDEVIKEISNLLKQEAILFPWQEGDILFLDNMLMAHAREPFIGERKIIVAMGEMMNAKDCDNQSEI